MKLTTQQTGLLSKMQAGRMLIKYPMHCGDPSYFVVEFKSAAEPADKRTVNSLIARGLVEFDVAGRYTSAYRLTDAGRKVQL